MASAAGTVTDSGHGHVVKVYDDDRDLGASIAGFLAEGIADGDLVLIVATPKHRRALAEAVRDLDVDLDPNPASGTGAVVALDAHDTLAAFMEDGAPDPGRFDDVLGRLVREAAPRRVRIFGEMVAVLWDEGNLSAALALEQLWNDLGEVVPFTLSCAYALSSFASVQDLRAIQDVCDHHAEVMGPQVASGEDSWFGDPCDDDHVSELFMPVPLSIRSSRRVVEHTLRSWGQEALLEDALVVASELATNAVLHAGSPFRLSLTRGAATIDLAVHDAGRGAPESRDASPEHPSGRGLALVEVLSQQWGTERVPDGKVVWARFDRATA